MKVHLMYESYDFDSEKETDPYCLTLIKDLELNDLFDVMSNDDKFVMKIVMIAFFSSLNNSEDILYRQSILKDCIKNSHTIRKIYNIASEAIERKKNYWWGIGSNSPSSMLNSSVNLLQMFMEMLGIIRMIIDESAENFNSKGFKRLIKMLQKEFNNDYLSKVKSYLNELKFSNGILISAELGQNNQGTNYVLCNQRNQKNQWLKWRLTPSIYIHERDDSGLKDLAYRKNRAIDQVSKVLYQAVENVLNFFMNLKNELAFYIGCLNLYDKASQMQEPLSFPIPVNSSERRHCCKGLYDVCLSLVVHKKVVSNELNADDKVFAVITGANQGGKSTFLRSIGQAQLMMQCGMFVAAEYFCANICNGVFTHFKREEDTSMKSGKLDEELERMSNIADLLRPNSLILFNESFAATNEREGSEIGRQIVQALLEKRIKVFFVTHLYEFANSFFEKNMENHTFLRAERQSNGNRTFKIREGRPLKTSFGKDLYYKISDSYRI